MNVVLKHLSRWFLVALICVAPFAHAADEAVGIGTETEAGLLKVLLNAIQDQNYDRFVSVGNEDFAKLDRNQFDAVAKELAPRLKEGYEADRLGNYRQQRYEFSLWKLSFKDGGDDLIGTLNVTNGRVGGFVLR